MTIIMDKLIDLRKQAATERSHYYVAGVVDDAMDEIDKLRARIKRRDDTIYNLNCRVTELRRAQGGQG